MVQTNHEHDAADHPVIAFHFLPSITPKWRKDYRKQGVWFRTFTVRERNSETNKFYYGFCIKRRVSRQPFKWSKFSLFTSRRHRRQCRGMVPLIRSHGREWSSSWPGCFNAAKHTGQQWMLHSFGLWCTGLFTWPFKAYSYLYEL